MIVAGFGYNPGDVEVRAGFRAGFSSFFLGKKGVRGTTAVVPHQTPVPPRSNFLWDSVIIQVCSPLAPLPLKIGSDYMYLNCVRNQAASTSPKNRMNCNRAAGGHVKAHSRHTRHGAGRRWGDKDAI